MQVRPPPKLTEFPRYPIAAGISLLAIVATVAWWLDRDISPLLETAMIRRGAPYSPAPVDEPLQSGDTLFLVGAHEDLMRVMSRLEGRRAE